VVAYRRQRQQIGDSGHQSAIGGAAAENIAQIGRPRNKPSKKKSYRQQKTS